MSRCAIRSGTSVAASLVFALTLVLGAFADDWPQWLGQRRDGIWREKGTFDKFPEGGLKPRWSTKIGSGYGGPAVKGGKVYVLDRLLAEGAKNPDNPFKADAVPGKERLLCLDEKTGKELWCYAYDCTYKISYAAGPRTTPTVADGKVWALGAMGNLFCVDAETGKLIWSVDLKENNSGARVPFWGFAGSPLVDGDRLICIVGGKDSLVAAFDKNTGKPIWRALTANEPGYSSPVIITAGGKRQLIVWEPTALHSLDPQTGKEYWSEPVISKSGMSICTPRLAGNRLLVSSFYNGSMMMELDSQKPEAKLAWKNKGRGELPDQTEGLHSVMPTPFMRDGYIYGVGSHGELRCLKADDGQRVWASLAATTKDNKPVRWANAFLTPLGDSDRCLLFNEMGDLILARLTPKGYEEISRAHVIDPTTPMAKFGLGREQALPVVWTHPAYADRCIFARNDDRIVCVPLAAGK